MIFKMSASKATPIKALRYANDKAIAKDTFNMSCIGRSKTILKNNEFRELQKLSGKCESLNSRKTYHLKFSPKEKDIDKDILLKYGKEFLENKFKNCQATLSVHNDNGRNHLHIILNAVDLNLKKVRIDNKEYDKIKTYAQDFLAKKYGMEATTKKERIYNHQRKNIIECNIEKGRGNLKMSETQFIKVKADEIIKKEYVKSISDYKRELKRYGIELDTYTTKNNETKYSYKTERLKNGIGEDKLGKNYSYDFINSFYKKEVKDIKLELTKNSDIENMAKDLKEMVLILNPKNNKGIDEIDKLLNNKDMPLNTKHEFLKNSQDVLVEKYKKQLIEKLKDKKMFSEGRLKTIESGLIKLAPLQKIKSLSQIMLRLSGIDEQTKIHENDRGR